MVLLLQQMPGDSVHQCSCIISVAGVNHQSCGLVHHQNVLILIHHVQFHLFRNQFKRANWIGQFNRHHIQGFDLVIGFDRNTINTDIARLGRSLQPCP